MRKLKTLFTVLFLAVLGLGNVWAEEEVFYTLNCPTTSANNAYASYYDVTANGLTWNAPGNQSFTGYWRIGGKSLSNTNRVITGKSKVGSTITKVVLSHNGISNANLAVNGVKLEVASDDAFSDIVETVTPTASFAVSTAGTVTFAPASDEWDKDLYYRFTFTLTNSKTSNYGLDITKIEFYYNAEAPTCSTPTITFAEESVAKLTTDAAFTNAASVEFESVATGQTVTYSVEDGKAGVATVNASTGEVTIVGAGEAKIYASVAADATYCEKSAYYTLTVTAPEEGVSFEKELTAYTDWNFNNFETKQTNANVAAHSGMYFGTTGGKAGCTMTTKNKVNPASISFYVSKTTTNTTTSNWIVQVSTTGNSWTDVKTASATSMDRGTWVEVSQDLSTYTDVYVRVTYSGSTAVRTIDDVILTTRELAHSTVSFAQPAHGTVSASATENVEEGTQVTLTYTPADGYKLTAFDVYKTGDETTKVTVSADGKFTMPAYDVTATATIEVAKVFDGNELTLSGTYPTEFWKGDAFSHDGMTVTAHFNTGDETVTGVFSGYDMATAGTQTVTVTFTEGGVSQTATYSIEVKTIANTQETAYTPAQAKELFEEGKDLNTKVYVKGIVSSVYSTSLPADGYLNFYVSEDGTTEGLQFEFYKTYKAAGLTKWTSLEDVQVGDEVVGYGKLTYYERGAVYEFDGNTESYVASLNRPVVLKSIELNTDDVKKTYKIGSDDVFSAEGLVVTARYNVSSNDKTIDLANVNFSGYDMTVANTYTVTVSYTENEITKSATYQIQVKPNCETLATITKGAEANGTFDLSIKGEQCAETAISTVLTAEPAEHYHLASVTATNGTVGAIEGNTCTISEITADAEITAVFEEDAKGTATFVAGAAEATGTAPAASTKYVGETLPIPANTFVLAGHTFAGWKANETIYQKGDEYTVEGNVEFVAQWDELPVWAHTYESNVTVGTDAVKFSAEGTEYEAYKAGTSKVAGSTTVIVPAGATALHFHAAGWKEENVTLKVSNGATTLGTFALLADAGMTNNSPFTLQNDPEQTGYFMVALENITEETTITFEATAGKRFAIFGVNYVAPASVALTPASYTFEDTKENASATYEFTATKNIFATGDIVVTFEGADAAAFSAGTVDAETGKFIVTFAPTEVRAYSATVKVTVDGAEATATLAGEGISATKPEISVDAETIDFGKVKQDATVEGKSVNVTLEYLDAANVAISGTVFSIDKTTLTENGAITISANTAAMGTYSETLTISGEGATSKTVTITMEVISKYTSEYTSNVTVGGDIVIINEVEYEAIKKGTGNNSQSTTVTVPKGTQTLHFHAVAWNNEATVLVVKQGETTLGSFNLYKDAGVKGTGPTYTLEGDNYDTDQYFNVNVAAYTAEAEAEITFTTTASPYRFVLYGVNQEGGILPVLDHIAIEGTATELTYEAGATFDPAGLTVKAYYTMEGVIDESKTKTLAATDFEWSFSPATLAAGTESVEVTATYEDKTNSKTIEGLTVTVPVPEIEVSVNKLAFGVVELGEAVDAKAVTVTLKNLAAASVTISGEGAAKFAADATSLTESGDVSISVTTDEAGTFTATLTIAGEGAEDKTVALSMTVVDLSKINSEKVDFTTIDPYQSLTTGASTNMVDYTGATFKVSFAKNDGSQPKYYQNGEAARLYNKNTITIAAANPILGVNVDWVSGYVDNGMTIAYSADTKTATLTFSATCRFTAITVAYKAAAIGEVGYNTLAAAVTAANTNDEIVLLTDVNENIVVPAGKTFTLDLNGRVLNGAQAASTATIKNLGTLTVQNGTVKRAGEGSASYYIIENLGTMTLNCNVEGSASSSLIRNNAATALMTFVGGEYKQTGNFIVVKNDLGEVIINGGTFSTDASKNVLNNWDRMTINGGTFNGRILSGAYDIDNTNLTINGGTFNTEAIRSYVANGQEHGLIEIKGGEFTNTSMIYVGAGNTEADANIQIAISGGTFKTVVPIVYCAEDFVPKDNGDGTYGVKEAEVTTLREKLSGNAGTICLSQNATNLRGATFYEISWTDESKLYAVEVTGVLEAGVGYIFVPEAGATEITGALYGTELLEAKDAHNGLQGTLTDIAAATDNVLVNNYLLSQNKIVCCGENCSLAAGRAYIIMDGVPTTDPGLAPGRRRIAFGNANAEVTTGIENLTEDGVAAQKVMINGQLFIIRGEKMYNVEGQLVK